MNMQFLHSPSWQPVVNSVIILVTFILLFMWIKIKRKRFHKTDPSIKTSPEAKSYTLSSKDIKMVAGEDVITTQLDLARAYMELGKKNLAKSILYHVTKTGKPEQQKEAHKLLSTI